MYENAVAKEIFHIVVVSISITQSKSSRVPFKSSKNVLHQIRRNFYTYYKMFDSYTAYYTRSSDKENIVLLSIVLLLKILLRIEFDLMKNKHFLVSTEHTPHSTGSHDVRGMRLRFSLRKFSYTAQVKKFSRETFGAMIRRNFFVGQFSVLFRVGKNPDF